VAFSAYRRIAVFTQDTLTMTRSLARTFSLTVPIDGDVVAHRFEQFACNDFQVSIASTLTALR